MLTGRVALVTGGNSGVGFETAKQLAIRGANVVLACRSVTRGQQARQAIIETVEAKQGISPTVDVMHVDMGNLASVRACAEQFQRYFDRLDLLINNAGVSMPMKQEQVTVDGLESQFGINHVGHFLLTSQLLPMMKKYRRTDGSTARIVTVSSRAHRRAPPLDFSTLCQGTGRKLADYENSKLANLVFSIELHRRLQASGIMHVLSVAAHPGLCHTNLFAKQIRESRVPQAVQTLMSKAFMIVMQTAEMGSHSIVHAAIDANVHGGGYYGPDGWRERIGLPVKQTPSSASLLEECGKKLWELSEEITQTKFDV